MTTLAWVLDLLLSDILGKVSGTFEEFVFILLFQEPLIQ